MMCGKWKDNISDRHNIAQAFSNMVLILIKSAVLKAPILLQNVFINTV